MHNIYSVFFFGRLVEFFIFFGSSTVDLLILLVALFLLALLIYLNRKTFFASISRSATVPTLNFRIIIWIFTFLLALDLATFYLFTQSKSSIKPQILPSKEISWGESNGGLAIGTWTDIPNSKIHCWIKNISDSPIEYYYKPEPLPSLKNPELLVLTSKHEWKPIEKNPKGIKDFYISYGDIRSFPWEVTQIKPGQYLKIGFTLADVNCIEINEYSNTNSSFNIDLNKYFWPQKIFDDYTLTLQTIAHLAISSGSHNWTTETLKSAPITFQSQRFKKCIKKTVSHIYTHDALRMIFTVILLAYPILTWHFLKINAPLKKWVIFGIGLVFLFTGIKNSFFIQPIATGRDYSFPPNQSSSNFFVQAKDWLITNYPTSMEVFYWPKTEVKKEILREIYYHDRPSRTNGITFMHFFYPLSILIGLGLLMGTKEKFFIWCAFIYSLLFLLWIPFESQGYFYYANFCSAGYWFSYGTLFVTLRILIQLFIISLIYWFGIRRTTINN